MKIKNYCFTFSIICLIVSVIYLWMNDAAHVAFWMGLALFNQKTSSMYD